MNKIAVGMVITAGAAVMAVVAAAANLLQKTPGAENRAGRFLFLSDGSAMAIM